MANHPRRLGFGGAKCQDNHRLSVLHFAQDYGLPCRRYQRGSFFVDSSDRGALLAAAFCCCCCCLSAWVLVETKGNRGHPIHVFVICKDTTGTKDLTHGLSQLPGFPIWMLIDWLKTDKEAGLLGWQVGSTQLVMPRVCWMPARNYTCLHMQTCLFFAGRELRPDVCGIFHVGQQGI